MSLSAGTRLGPYEIQSALGAGGMGEVYRARDTRLDRTVALKILPASVADDPDRLRRFEQEARAAAALNHPGILALFDVGAADGTSFIVTELLEGATLRERLADTSLPARKAIAYAAQMAQALGAAHEQGVVHRDLKPENVFVTRDDRVKVLDFGLAKLTGAAVAATATLAPTMAGGTAAGMVLGTVGYMAPEQVRGLDADHRADIFALGVLLFEMLTGERAFPGDVPAEVMSAILKDDPPDLSARARVAPAVDQIVRRCLEKSPDARFQSARDLAFALEALSASSSGVQRATAPSPWRRIRPLMAAAALLIAGAAAAIGAGRWLPRDIGPLRVSLLAPDGTTLKASTVALSPDARSIAFTAESDDGTRRLYVRALHEADARALPGTEGARNPFWSPDGRAIAFFAARKLKRIEAAGGPVQSLADASDPRGGSWSSSGDIVFAPMGGDGLYRVPEGGGDATPLTRLDLAQNEVSHRWPHMLPDGRHFVFMRRVAPREGRLMVAIASFDVPAPRLLFEAQSSAVYAEQALLAVQDRSLIAVPFDLKSGAVAGPRTVFAENVWLDRDTDGLTALDARRDVLAFRSGDGDRHQLVITDGQGRVLSQIPGAKDAGDVQQARFSPNGRHVAFVMQPPGDHAQGMWIQDLTRGTLGRFGPPQNDGDAVWSPDGTRIAFSSDRSGTFDLYIGTPGGPQQPLPTTDTTHWKRPQSWSADGRWLLYSEQHPKNRRDLWVRSMSDGTAVPYLQSPADESHARFSPDGRWVAYASDENGREDVYLQQFPATEIKHQISTAGGAEPTWRGDGRMLFYLTPDNWFVSVPVTIAGSQLRLGTPTRLFQVPLRRSTSFHSYDVSPDGQRFAINGIAPAGRASAIDLIIGWRARAK